MNKTGKIKISKDIIEWIKVLAEKEKTDLSMYIEMVLMKHSLKESLGKNN